jgi:purine-binding chemotaxis protein CheW
VSRRRDSGDTVMSAAGTCQLVVFSLAGEEYALPIAAVSEIIRHVPPRSVASETAGVRGVIGLRGKIIPIVDLSARLGLAPAPAEAVETGKIVILDTDGDPVGVVVDDVDEVLTVSVDQLEAVPTAGDAIEAIAKLEDRLVMLLDAAAIVAPQPEAALAAR